MSKAKKALAVPFNKAAEMMQGLRRSELTISFHCYNDCGEEVIVGPIKASDLYRDWYGDCDCCPPNDACIERVRILLPTHVSLDITDKVIFEHLMDTIESVTASSTKKIRVFGHTTVVVVKEIEVDDDEKLSEEEIYDRAKREFGGIHQFLGNGSNGDKLIGVKGSDECIMADEEPEFYDFERL